MEKLSSFELLIELYKRQFELFNNDVIKYQLSRNYEEMRKALKERDFFYERLKHYGEI